MASDDVCRICMNTNAQMQSIFCKPEMMRKSLPEIVFYVTGIQIEEYDGLPNHICIDCINLAQSASLFKDLCVESEIKLKGVNNVTSGYAGSYNVEIVEEKNSDERPEYLTAGTPIIKKECENFVCNSDSDPDQIKAEGEGFNNGDKNGDISKSADISKKPYKCGFCNFQFGVCTELKYHVQEKHKLQTSRKERPKAKNPCHICGRFFNSIRNLNSHILRCQARAVKINRTRSIKEEIVTSDSDTPLAENCRRESFDNDASVDCEMIETDKLKVEPSEYIFENNEITIHQVRGETKKKKKCEECNLDFTLKDYNHHLKTVHNKTLSKKTKKTPITKKKKNKKVTKKSDDEYPVEWLEVAKDEIELNPVIYPCTKCERKFTKEVSLIVHLKRHEALTEQVHSCPNCKREFKRKAHLDNHVLTHAVDQGFQCSQCPKSFAKEESLKIHLEHHKGTKRHQCKFCDKGFNMSSTLRDHVRTHTGEKPFLCSICGRGFSQSTNLKEHLRRHQGYKPFKCIHCDQTFVSKGELEAHTRKHSGAHPFVCDVCGGGFTTSSSLVKHKRIHTGERPYHCDFCPQRFTALGTLKNHRRTHTGEKPYK